MIRLELELFVLGNTLNSQTAITNLTRICETSLRGLCEVVVIDVLEQPQAAELANVVATPTLIKRSPAPVWRMVGDLSKTDVVLRGLGVEETNGEERDP